MTADDIPSAMRLKDTAGWNQTETDWRNLLRLAPDGCFAIDCDGRLAATTTAVCFGEELAWIGMVLTHPDYRGRGFGRALMEQALAALEGRVDWVKLDATDMGRPLYSKLGFADECPIERWRRPPGEVGGTQDLAGERSLDLILDRTAFGADRAGLLSVLVQGQHVVSEHGYAMGRPGTRAAYFGPCVSASGDEVRRLLRWFLARHAEETVFWDLLPGNEEAAAIAREFGFEPLRKLVRMARRVRTGAQPMAHDDSLVYAIAGFEFG